MVMDTMQIRLSHGLVEKIDSFVGLGIYSSRADVIRDAVRRFVLDTQIGSVRNTGDSVKEIRGIRKTLSKDLKNVKDLNSINILGE